MPIPTEEELNQFPEEVRPKLLQNALESECERQARRADDAGESLEEAKRTMERVLATLVELGNGQHVPLQVRVARDLIRYFFEHQ